MQSTLQGGKLLFICIPSSKSRVQAFSTVSSFLFVCMSLYGIFQSIIFDD